MIDTRSGVERHLLSGVNFALAWTEDERILVERFPARSEIGVVGLDGTYHPLSQGTHVLEATPSRFVYAPKNAGPGDYVLYDLGKNQKIAIRFPDGPYQPVGNWAFSPSGQYLATFLLLDARNHLAILDSATGEVLDLLPTPTGLISQGISGWLGESSVVVILAEQGSGAESTWLVELPLGR